MVRSDLVSKDPATGRVRPSDLPAVVGADSPLPLLYNTADDVAVGAPFVVATLGGLHGYRLAQAAEPGLARMFGAVNGTMLTRTPSDLDGSAAWVVLASDFTTGGSYLIPEDGAVTYTLASGGNRVTVFYIETGATLEVVASGGTTQTIVTGSSGAINSVTVTTTATSTVVITSTSGTSKVLGISDWFTSVAGYVVAPVSQIVDPGMDLESLITDPAQLSQLVSFCTVAGVNLLLVALTYSPLSDQAILAGNIGTVLAALEPLFAASTAVLGVTLYPNSNDVINTQQVVMRAVCAEQAVSLFDAHRYLNDDARLVALGWAAVDAVPNTSYYSYLMPVFFRDLGLVGLRDLPIPFDV